MKMTEGASVSGTGVEDVLNSLEWTSEDVIALNNAIVADDGKCLIPAGVNGGFHMIGIKRKFQLATKKTVESSVIYDLLNECYELEEMEECMECPFPNEQVDFSLPDSEFSQLIKDRLMVKILDDDSRDSGSGRETPPTLPIAKRSGGVQSAGNKRKHSSSFSDAGSETAAGRKSNSGPGCGQPKTKRRQI